MELIHDYPLTEVEQGLKYYFTVLGVQPDTVLTPEEALEYMLEMGRRHGRHLPAGSQPGKRMIYNQRLRSAIIDAGQEGLEGSPGKAVARHLTAQDEELEILPGYDIAAWRLFRYMPAYWHSNEYFDVYYCASGVSRIIFEKGTISLRAGSLLILAPGVRHATACYSDDAVVFCYDVRSSTFEQVFWNQLNSGSLMEQFFREALSHRTHAAYLQFDTEMDETILQLLQRIYAEYADPQNYGAQLINALMSEFFILLLRGYEGSARLPRTEDFYWKHEFSAVLTYIEHHFHDKKLPEMAQDLNYSERQINRIVSRITGNNYSHLILRLRMERAAALFQNKMTPEEVAFSVGYSSLSSFYRAFTAWYGQTPAEYRKTVILRS